MDPTTGCDQPVGVPGEILVRGYTVMQGYYRKPEETAKAVDSEGWLHSGDMGLMRPDGHLRFMGRYKDMLKIGGENVDPLEVEAYLASHPAINAAAVVGAPFDLSRIVEPRSLPLCCRPFLGVLFCNDQIAALFEVCCCCGSQCVLLLF